MQLSNIFVHSLIYHHKNIFFSFFINNNVIYLFVCHRQFFLCLIINIGTLNSKMIKPKSFQHNHQIKIKHPRSSLPSHRKSSIGFKPLRQSINANMSIIDHSYAYIQNKAKQKQKESKSKCKEYSQRFEMKASGNKQCYSSATILHQYNLNQSCLSDKIAGQGKSQRQMKSKRQKIKKECENSQRSIPKQYIKQKNISHRASISESFAYQNSKQNYNHNVAKAYDSKIMKNRKKSYPKQQTTINPKQKPFRCDSVQNIEDLQKIKLKIQKTVSSSRNQCATQLSLSKFCWISIIRLCFLEKDKLVRQHSIFTIPIKSLKKTMSNILVHLTDKKIDSKYESLKALIAEQEQLCKKSPIFFQKISYNSLLRTFSRHPQPNIDFETVLLNLALLMPKENIQNICPSKHGGSKNHLKSHSVESIIPQKLIESQQHRFSKQQFAKNNKIDPKIMSNCQPKKGDFFQNKKNRNLTQNPIGQQQNVQTARFKEKSENLKNMQQFSKQQLLKKIMFNAYELSPLSKSKLVQSIQIFEQRKSRESKNQEDIEFDRANILNSNKSKYSDKLLPFSKSINSQQIFPQHLAVIDTQLVPSIYSSVSRFYSSLKNEESLLQDYSQTLQQIKTKLLTDDKINSAEYDFLNQLLDSQLYTDLKGAFFHAVKICLKSNQTQELKEFLLQNCKDLKNYLSCISALKLINFNPPIMLQIIPNLSKSLAILNISNNNLHSLSMFEDKQSLSHNSESLTRSTVPSLFLNLQFLNISNNKIRNIHQILQISSLKQLHCRNNLIDHVTGNVKAINLVMVDLAYNQITTEYNLYAFGAIPQLKIINIQGNPIIKNRIQQFKILKQDILQQYEQLYIFSDFKQYKDITFNSTGDFIEELRPVVPHFNINQTILTNSGLQQRHVQNKEQEMPSAQSPISSPKRKNISSFNWKKQSYTNHQNSQNIQTVEQKIVNISVLDQIQDPNRLKSSDKYLDSFFNIQKNLLKRIEEKFKKKNQ